MGEIATKVRNGILIAIIMLGVSFTIGMFEYGAVILLYSGLVALVPDVLPQPDHVPYVVQIALAIWVGQMHAYLSVERHPFASLPGQDLRW